MSARTLAAGFQPFVTTECPRFGSSCNVSIEQRSGAIGQIVCVHDNGKHGDAWEVSDSPLETDNILLAGPDDLEATLRQIARYVDETHRRETRFAVQYC